MASSSNASIDSDNESLRKAKLEKAYRYIERHGKGRTRSKSPSYNRKRKHQNAHAGPSHKKPQEHVIKKPKGEVGRAAPRGYNLQEAMGNTARAAAISYITRSGHLWTTFSQIPSNIIAAASLFESYYLIHRTHPELKSRYENEWATTKLLSTAVGAQRKGENREGKGRNPSTEDGGEDREGNNLDDSGDGNEGGREPDDPSQGSDDYWQLEGNQDTASEDEEPQLDSDNENCGIQVTKFKFQPWIITSQSDSKRARNANKSIPKAQILAAPIDPLASPQPTITIEPKKLCTRKNARKRN
ncbi:uncharacterized protein EI90DRAFT_3019275 [Cantharellus anzutake]|uniref:uncharacterized protein n=1 Tax=Cantharellus anzutake TaxID=1750568 RepID=UPI001905FACF|nr:uncharacterized protein EI90DRAFT_3019275 [Cantharellus anzutake]KAF8325101.1 hypothetical protein EI90DRAFT_3019275 [Cantharellus anzutake]